MESLSKPDFWDYLLRSGGLSGMLPAEDGKDRGTEITAGEPTAGKLEVDSWEQHTEEVAVINVEVRQG
jgi:hypothetical protein